MSLTNTTHSMRHALSHSLVRWFDAYAVSDMQHSRFEKRIDWLRAIPFVVLHVSVLFVFVVGWSP